MTSELASWRPLGDAMDMLERNLGMAIRRALPSNALRGTPEWERGTLTWDLFSKPVVENMLESGTKPVQRKEQQQVQQERQVQESAGLLLASLTWRLRDTLLCSGRGMSEWRFHGIAWYNDARIDFSGECLRDTATGGFWEFRLQALGFAAAVA